MTDPIPAATVIIVRDQPNGYEVLMVERHAQLAFAGGAAVFPGGRIDEDDHRIAASARISETPAGLESFDAAARVAAMRESLEETGIAIGIDELPLHRWAAWRAALHSGEPFSEILMSERLRLNLGSLTPFARWLPPSRRLSRIFDTRFYIARAPEDAPTPFLPDGRETTRIFWTRPQDMLESAVKGGARIIFPTRRNLERLAVHADYAALEAHARSITVRTIQPQTEEAEGRHWLVIPDDQGYPLTREPLDSAERE